MKHWNVVDQHGFKLITFDMEGEKVNKFNEEVLDELETLVKGLTNAKAAVFLSGKKESFIVGADLKKFEEYLSHPDKVKPVLEKGHRIFRMIEKLPFPTVAVINGVCVGGGLEFALACSHRLVTDSDKTQLGLPETSLGIIPGWGGSQRLPRLVGLQNSLRMILGGRPVNAKKAFRMGLADQIVADAFLDVSLSDEVSKVIQRKKKSKRGIMKWLLEKNPLGRSVVYNVSKKSVLKKTKGHYPAPLVALDLVHRTYTKSLDKGLKEEVQTFLDHCSTSFQIAPHLISVFFSVEKLKKPDLPAHPPIKRIGVVGSGIMGSGLAWLASARETSVRMTDINTDALAKGLKEIGKTYKTYGKIKRLKPDRLNFLKHHISWGTDNSHFKSHGLVIEAATENLELKHRIFEEIESSVSKETLIASNTSSLTIREMSSHLKHPERFLGMHFFNPVPRMPLVEIVRGEKTSDEAIEKAIQLCLTWKKVPLVVKDCHGFLVNRIIAMQMNVFASLLENGVPLEKVKKAALSFGFPMDPFELADQVGIDVSAKVFSTFEKAYGKRMAVPELISQMAKREWYGKKSGKGFYTYSKKRKELNPGLKELLPSSTLKMDEQEIISRVITAMVLEADRCLEEGIVGSVRELDTAMILGTGFPPFRGGLLTYANEVGLDVLLQQMESFAKRDPERYTPTPSFISRAKEGRTYE